MFKRNKRMLTISLIISLFAVFVTAISTAAWFQIEKQDPETKLVTGSSSIAIQDSDVVGYKIDTPIGANGFRDYAASTVSHMAGDVLDFDNPDKEGADTVYDVPGDVGYYLVKQNTSGTFKYVPGYFTRFNKYSETYTKAAQIEKIEFVATTKVRIREYQYSGSTTVDRQIKIGSVYGGSASIDDNGDVTVAAGTYRVWLDFRDTDDDAKTITGMLGFETYAISSTVNGNSVSIRSKVSRSMDIPTSNTRSAIDTGTTFSKFGFEQTWANSATDLHDGHQNMDWFVRLWGGSHGDDAYPGYFLANDKIGAQSTVWITPPTYLTERTGFQITAWEGNGYNGTIGVSVGGWGDYYTWKGEKSSLTASSFNFVKVTGGSNYTLTIATPERCSVLNIYKKLGTSTAVAWQTIDVWNKNTVKGSLENAGKYASPGDIDDYTFVGYYRDSSCTQAFVPASHDGHLTHDAKIYAKYELKPDITRKAGCFIYDGTNYNYVKTIDLDPDQADYGKSYTPGNNVSPATASDVYELDSTNGIYYKFSQLNGTWYDDLDTCKSGSGGYTSKTFTANATIYTRFVADISNSSTTHKTFYVDISQAKHTYSETDYYWDASYRVKCRYKGTNVDILGVKSGPKLFRFTTPTDATIQLYRGDTTFGGGSNQDYSTEIASNRFSEIVSQKTIIYIEPGTVGNNHDWQPCQQDSLTSNGTAQVQYYDGDSWEKLVDMNVGNGNNKFIYEKGYVVPVNTPLRIAVDNSGWTYYGFSNYAGSKPYFFNSSAGTNNSLVTANYSGTVEFNFYLTTSNQVSVAMVPTLGNGYYIMEEGHTSWDDPNNAYIMTEVDLTEEQEAVYDAQYKGVIHFKEDDVFKVRSESWLNLKYENSGAISSGDISISTDGNNNLIVNEEDTYVLYLKKFKDVSEYELYVAATEETLASNGNDSSFSSSKFYVVGSTNLSSATSVNPVKNCVGFQGGKKMGMTSEISATYNGYFARSNSQLYIRSYLNAVDTLYKANQSGSTGTDTTFANASGVTLNTSTGLITFGDDTAGYYNIYVYDGKISIESVTPSEFFRLNPLDTRDIDDQQAVFNQKTALVLEVPFICNVPYTTKLSLGVQNAGAHTGAFLYCSLTKLEDPYNTLHDAYNETYANLEAVSDGVRIDDVNDVVIPANSDAVVYAYILIDYLYDGTYANPYVSTNTQLNFYLTATQR